MSFDKGTRAASAVGQELTFMSDFEKQDLAHSLLEEFGAQNIHEQGDELQHSCVLPFGLHSNGDRSASASFNWRKLTYNCFVCGGGGFVWFVSTCRGQSIEQVQTWAESKTTLDGSEESLASLLTYLDHLFSPSMTVPDAPIPHFNPAILEPWMLVHPYLTEIRHIPRANIIKHKVGYDEKAERIIFPHFWKDALVGWQSRRIVKDGTPKYLNTPDFPKDKTLYNYSGFALFSPVVVVESPMTVVAKSHLEDYNWLATFGAQVTDRQLRLLNDLGRVYLWFDNDKAGWSAVRNVGEYLVKYVDVYVVDSPWNEDGGGLDDGTTLGLLEHVVPYHLWRPPEAVLAWEGRDA